MAIRSARLLATAACLALVACAQGPPPAPVDRGPPAHTVFVTGNGWHTEIVIAREDLPGDGRLAEVADFPGAAFLAFGWGDREYYPARDPGVSLALRAALVPSASLMRITGLAESPERRHAKTDVLALPVSAIALDRLVSGIDATFDRPSGGRAAPVAREGDGLFYPARGEFHLFNNCNTWTAQRLAAAGTGLDPSGVVRADPLIERVAALAGVKRLAARGG